jgi:hypothetical protein
MMTAETFNPTIAQALVTQMNLGKGQSQNCKTAATYTGSVETRAAEACIRLDPDRMVVIANTSNPATPNAWVLDPDPKSRPGFTERSFGDTVGRPYITVEVTNPTNTEVTAGNSQTVRYNQVTVTVFVQMKNVPALASPATIPAETMIAGRGRITVGPSLAGGGAPSNF